MLNAVKAELIKLKKNTMVLVGTLIVLLVPVFLIMKDRFLSTPSDDKTGWLLSCLLVDFTVLSLMSGFIITSLMQREYQEHTLINILTSSVSRVTFLFSKVIVWLVWYLCMLAIIIGLTALGAAVIYPGQFGGNDLNAMAALFSKFGLLNFIAFLPLLWVTVLQKKLFYPSLLTAAGFTILLIAGVNVTENLILPASFVPWPAVPILSLFHPGTPSLVAGYASVLTAGVLGLVLAAVSFCRQDQ